MHYGTFSDVTHTLDQSQCTVVDGVQSVAAFDRNYTA